MVALDVCDLLLPDPVSDRCRVFHFDVAPLTTPTDLATLADGQAIRARLASTSFNRNKKISQRASEELLSRALQQSFAIRVHDAEMADLLAILASWAHRRARASIIRAEGSLSQCLLEIDEESQAKRRGF